MLLKLCKIMQNYTHLLIHDVKWFRLIQTFQTYKVIHQITENMMQVKKYFRHPNFIESNKRIKWKYLN